MSSQSTSTSHTPSASPSHLSVTDEARVLLSRLGVKLPLATSTEHVLHVHSPINGHCMAQVPVTTQEQAQHIISQAHQAFLQWRSVPAPVRGEMVRLLGEELRAAKTDLARLVTLEAGKIISEGLGEVQEMIDICDYATGLSRQLCGLTIATERAQHRMMETWHPLGVCGVISAFNFPVAVWSWNAAIALVCGNSVVWKPSEKTPLTALAVHAIAHKALQRFGQAPEGLLGLLIGGAALGQCLVQDTRVPIVSATGSTAMGRHIAPQLSARFARSILELGGNNAAIVTPSADLNLSLRAIAFAAMGTAGQRCTTLRRLFVHDSVYDALLTPLKKVYSNVQVGDPRDSQTLVGPLIDAQALQAMQVALQHSVQAGGVVHEGQALPASQWPAARDMLHSFYARPALVEMPAHTGPVLHETFAPILYVMRYQRLEQAIEWNNAVGAGLSSSIFTMNMREAELFISSTGSDCGIANVNIGPSGAEIGGAFGGEKETGGGREAGSDSWKAYMRRATNTINYSTALPLAQGVSFEVDL